MVAIPFQTIMVALDESSVSETAFTAAKELAQALSANLILVHVFNPLDRRSPKPLYNHSDSPLLPIDQTIHDQKIHEKKIHEKYEREWVSFVQHHESRLRQKVDEAIAVNIEADFTQPYGSPGPTLCAIAKSANASLLVVGSHQRRGMAEIMLGSISNYITHHAPCSVLVVYAHDAENEPSANVKLETNVQKSEGQKSEKATDKDAIAA